MVRGAGIAVTAVAFPAVSVNVAPAASGESTSVAARSALSAGRAGTVTVAEAATLASVSDGRPRVARLSIPALGLRDLRVIPYRGWTDDEWAAAADALTSRGLLGPDGRATPAGVDRLGRAEALTDELAHEPWALAGAGTTSRFLELATPLAVAARAALPPVNPIGLPAGV